MLITDKQSDCCIQCVAINAKDQLRDFCLVNSAKDMPSTHLLQAINAKATLSARLLHGQ
jgi:hypothetical protein